MVMAHRPVLKVDVVGFEIDVAEKRLQRGAVRACTDEGRVERGCDEKHCGLRVILGGLRNGVVHEGIVPDVHEVTSGGIPCGVECCCRVELTLRKSKHHLRTA